MKIGIITYQRSHNYGAVLQAYALLSTLNELGHDVNIINYWPRYRDGMYDNFKIKHLPKNTSFIDKMKVLISDLISYERRNRRSIKFEKFIKIKLKLDNNTIINGEDIIEKYDLIVYGSDQIWRFNNYNLFKGFDPVYWGKFPVNCSRKITYAASMGVMEINDSKLSFIKDNLSNFNSISVRESSLKLLIEPLTEKNIEEVLDPVFLRTQSEWSELSSPAKIKGKYVLFYNLLSSVEGKLIADQIALKLDCRVIEISGNIQPFKFSNRFQQTVGPDEYVNLFKNAEFVISTSFHGVAFSIIFDKQFYALGMGKNSSRVQSLLNKLNISNRLIDGLSDIDFESTIDYLNVNKILDIEIQKSLLFLRNNI